MITQYGMMLDLFLHGPQKPAAEHYMFARQALSRIAWLVKDTNSETKDFVTTNYDTIKELYHGLYDSIPWYYKLFWKKLRKVRV